MKKILSLQARPGFRTAAAAFMALLVLPLALAQETGGNGNKEKEKEKERGKAGKSRERASTQAANGVEQKESIATVIGNFTGVGRGHRELIIPQRDKKSRKLSSRITLRSVDRTDETTLRFQGLFVQEYTEQEAEDFYIDVRSGTFDMTTGVLAGDDISRVGVPGRFEIVGAGLVCDTSEKEVDGKTIRAQYGKMAGPVKMTIFDASTIGVASASSQPAGKPESAKPANTAKTTK